MIMTNNGMGRRDNQVGDLYGYSYPMPAKKYREELLYTVHVKRWARYSKKVVEVANKWETDDLATVSAICQSLLGNVPDPTAIYLLRCTEPKYIDMKSKKIYNNGKALAEIYDGTRLGRVLI